jgi:hypothetical protein
LLYWWKCWSLSVPVCICIISRIPHANRRHSPPISEKLPNLYLLPTAKLHVQYTNSWLLPDSHIIKHLHRQDWKQNDIVLPYSKWSYTNCWKAIACLIFQKAPYFKCSALKSRTSQVFLSPWWHHPCHELRKIATY